MTVADMTADMAHLLLQDQLHRFFCRYFDVNEAPDFDLLPTFYTENAQFNVYISRAHQVEGKASVSARGRSSIVDTVRQALTLLEQTHHTMGNFWVEVEDGQPVARAHIRAYHRATGEALGKDEESLATFTAYMTQAEGGWKIARFDYVILIVLGSFDAFPLMTK